MKYINSEYIDEFQHPLHSFLKLEILDSNLYPNDLHTLEIIEKLEPNIRKVCIPFLSGENNSLSLISKLGCPAARIWCSDIGKGAGITDKLRLERLVNSTNLPLILEGGISTPYHVQEALTIGFRAVLMNSAFRQSSNPIELAEKVRIAIDSSSKL